jgi:hypothetical protein
MRAGAAGRHGFRLLVDVPLAAGDTGAAGDPGSGGEAGAGDEALDGTAGGAGGQPPGGELPGSELSGGELSGGELSASPAGPREHLP